MPIKYEMPANMNMITVTYIRKKMPKLQFNRNAQNPISLNMLSTLLMNVIRGNRILLLATGNAL